MEQQNWIDEWLVRVAGGEKMVGTMKGRIRVAAACGYLDARLMVYMLETHGFPLSHSALKAAEHGLRVDFSGLQFELEMLRIRSGIGDGKLNVEAEMEEIRYFLGVVEARNEKARAAGQDGRS